MALFVTIVLDGVGVGGQPDAAAYGDEGSNTLVHVCEAASPHLPVLASLGIGCIATLNGIPAVERPRAAYGRMLEVSAGKDSTSGHWELAGIRLDRPFPTYPYGFPGSLVSTFVARVGVDGVLGNRAASGTQIVEELGAEHVRTGRPIVYTSADSVFQVAAHINTISPERLYSICQLAREQVCVGEHAVGRVIARPFAGDPGGFYRLSQKRRDFALRPPSPSLPDTLQQHGVHTSSIGKVSDLFAGFGFDSTTKTSSNADGIGALLASIKGTGDDERKFVWANLVDFDQEFGHRNDVSGFARSLGEFDSRLEEILQALPRGGRLVITADHGNDPTFPGTDHTREYVPLLYLGGRSGVDLGTRQTFADHAATVLQFFDAEGLPQGRSFL